MRIKAFIRTFFLFAVIFTTITTATAGQNPKKDFKSGDSVFIITSTDSNYNDAIAEKIKKISAGNNPDAKPLILKTDGLNLGEKISNEILIKSEGKPESIGAIFNIVFTGNSTNSPGIDLQVYHYPFPAIAKEHIDSPEYSYKFASDSSLLAIKLYEAFAAGLPSIKTIISPQIKNPLQLSGDYLKKSIVVQINNSEKISEKEMSSILTDIVQAFTVFLEDDGSYLIGILPEKVQKKAKTENLELKVAEFALPTTDEIAKANEERASDKEEKSFINSTSALFPNYLFFIKDLKKITPYILQVKDTSKPADYLGVRIWKYDFLTSDLGGIVRTMPDKSETYSPVQTTGKTAVYKTETTPDTKADFIIENATVIDGTNETEPFNADVAVTGEKITAVGDLKKQQRKTTIDGKGLYLTPGFIDIHSHVDFTIFESTKAISSLQQGITTALGGNCSFAPIDMGVFNNCLETSGTAINTAMLLGNKSIRQTVLGRRKVQPEYTEVYIEKEYVDLGMENGAFGLSTGLIYDLGKDAYEWEIMEITKQIKPYGGFYASHVRGESEDAVDAIREAMFVGELAEVPVQISHIKAIGKPNWGKINTFLDYIEKARAEGQDVTCDEYPWLATGASHHYKLYRLIERDGIKRERPETVLIKQMPEGFEKYNGKLLSDILKEENITAEEFIKKINLKPDSKAYGVSLCLSEKDLQYGLSKDYVMVCTDSGLKKQSELDKNDYEGEHPRKFTTFPKFFAEYVRDKKVCSWKTGVYKCTGLPAKRLKLNDRGTIKQGNYADLVLFDPEKLAPGSDYVNPEKKPVGIKYVFVNGAPALKDSNVTDTMSGKALRAYGNRKP